jgi:hypothetical protein
MNKQFLLKMLNEGGRWSEDGPWTEFVSRKYEFNVEANQGKHSLLIEISEHLTGYGGYKRIERYEFHMPENWHPIEFDLAALPVGEHRASELEEPWLDFINAFTDDFQSFTAVIESDDNGERSIRSGSLISLVVENDSILYSETRFNEDPRLKVADGELSFEISLHPESVWPTRFYEEFRKIFGFDDYQPDWDEEPISEESIHSYVTEMSLQKTTSVYEDLRNGMKLQFKKGLGGLRGDRIFADDLWGQIRLICRLERETK